jgi:hypothetical protein
MLARRSGFVASAILPENARLAAISNVKTEGLSRPLRCPHESAGGRIHLSLLRLGGVVVTYQVQNPMRE